jgi:D-hexose-6-phosphate mutarotase
VQPFVQALYFQFSIKCVVTFFPQVRGGIPIAFPQFARQGALPLHGFAREKKWRVDKVCSVSRWGQPASAILTLESDSSTRALWDHAFRLELTVVFIVCTIAFFFV